VEFSVGASSQPGTFSATSPAKLENSDFLWIKVIAEINTRYYKIRITVEEGSDPTRISGGIPTLTPFDITNLPAPAAWNAAGDMYDYPNLFLRADGTQITSPLEWEEYRNAAGVSMGTRPMNNIIPEGWTIVPGGRRAEVKRIVEYYHQGTMPPPPDLIEIVTDPGPSGGPTTLRLTHAGRSVTLTASISIPANAPNGKTRSPENKVPLFFSIGSSVTGLADNGWAIINVYPSGSSTDNPAGPIQELFQFNNDNDPDRPSALLRGAWYASRWMDAAEMGAWGGVVDATKTAVSGVSRNGKGAMIVGAFAESKKGTRLTISVPASSGAGGTNMERWTHQKQGMGRPAGGYNRFGLMGINHYEIGNATSNRVMVKLAPKDWHDINDPDWMGKADIKFHRTQLQGIGHAKEEQINWFSNRIREFAEQNNSFHLQGAGSNRGTVSTLPMDAHFVAALSAPNIWLGCDGWAANALSGTGNSGWVSQEPMYMTYLAARELYDFLGYDENIGILLHHSAHAWPTQQINNFIDYANWFFNKYHHPNAAPEDMYRRVSGTQKLTTIEQVTDRLRDDSGNPVAISNWYNPLAREDYLRLNWKNPNRTKRWEHEFGTGNGRSIADNVRAYFNAHPDELIDLLGNPVVIDYPKSLVPEGY
jgi:hypothetical protein